MLSTLILAFSALAQTPAAPAAPVAPVQEADPSWEAQTICPVSAEPLDGEKSHFVDFEGQRIYVCCKKCVKKAAADPEQMLFVLAQAGQATESTNTICPVSGEKLDGRDHVVWVGNKSFAVCCKKCHRKASGTPAVYLDKLEGRTKQTLCPISGEKVDPKVATEVNGFQVKACCEKCVAKIEADPNAALAKLASQKVVLEPIAKTCTLNPKEKRDAQVFVTVGAQRHYFCCNKCRGKWLAKRAAPKKTEAATAGALQFLGGDGR